MARRSTRLAVATSFRQPGAASFSTTPTTLNSIPKTPAAPSSNQAPTTQGTVPPNAPDLIAPFPSESVEHLYAKRTPSPSDAVPADSVPHSSTSVDPPHPTTTAQAPHTGQEAVGTSASVRYREASWEGGEKGGNYGTGLMDESAVVENKESQLAERNRWPDEEQGRMGNQEAWKSRK